MDFLNERAACRAIRREMRMSERAELAVAFWGDGATEKLGIADRKPGSVSIVCNLSMGGTNPAEIKWLMELGHEVVQCDRLHAKCYVFDDAVLIGSSNASSNGLAFQEGETQPWIEANVFSRDEALVSRARRWLARLPTSPITAKDLAAAREAWNRRRQAAPTSTGVSLIEQLGAMPTFFDGKQVFLAVVSQDMAAEAEQVLEQAQAESGSVLDAYEDWPELPDSGILIGFQFGPRGGLSLNGIFERRPSLKERKLPSGGTLQLCIAIDDVFGMKVFGRDMSAWKEICRRFRDDPEAEWHAEGGCGFVDLSVVARKYLA